MLDSLFHCGMSRTMVLNWVLVGSAVMVVLQLLFTYTPVMNRLFQTAPVSLQDWGMILMISFGVYLIIGLEKMVRNRKKS